MTRRKREPMELGKYDVIVVGSGFSGAVAAEILSHAGKNVAVLERRGHIGGNMHETRLKEGFPRVHLYGPHIFHTNSAAVYDYLSRFTKWIPYEHRVLGRIDGHYVPIPFNFASMDALLPEAEAMKAALTAAFPKEKTVSVRTLLYHENVALRRLGQFVYEKVFVHYTAKQWGVPIEQVPSATIDRVPVRLGYDDRYFSDRFQAMPKEGYGPIFEKLLADCDVFTGVDGRCALETGKPVLYTGAVDELFNGCFGPLPYRTVRMEFEHLEVERFQSAAVVNYPNEEDFTRITEFKTLTGERCATTTILREYPQAYAPGRGEPYYPVASADSESLYERYSEKAKQHPNLFLCGRLAEYRYYNMDQCIARAMEAAQEVLRQTNS